MTGIRIGVDIGGTFTDFVVHDEASGQQVGLKVPTVPGNPADGLAAGLAKLSANGTVDPERVTYFVHGTTIAVNALIQRRGARLGLLVTRGFRDLLIIQRLRIPEPQNWNGGRPEPLVPRHLIFEVDERLRADGSSDRPISDADVRSAVDAAIAEGVEGLVVCFLHSFRNPIHEARAKAVIRERAPGLLVCCSHEIWPQMREYERAVITAINAYVMPPVVSYLRRLEERLDEFGIGPEPYITRSNGGIMSARQAASATAETLLSGPASGVIGAVRVAEAAGLSDVVTLDVGGTSADVAIIQNGQPQVSISEHVADFPIMMPVVGVSSVGAGGGSIAWLDSAGVLKVGPDSAGADPGPACYGKGNDRPTLTDAFLALGMLNPDSFAGGQVRIDRELSEHALVPVARGLNCNVKAAAEGIVSVAVAGMYAEFSNLAARRGIDAREFTMVAFGGAGPLVACRLADELAIKKVLIPPTPGTLCAFGALSADLAQDFVTSLLVPLEKGMRKLQMAFDGLRAQASEWLRSEAPETASHRLVWSADMRYLGQSYEVPVSLEEDWIRHGDQGRVSDAFHRTHQAVYSHADLKAPVELVDLRLRLVAPMPKPDLATWAPTPASKPARRLQSADSSVPRLWRQELSIGDLLKGPAMIDQDDTTTHVPAGWIGRLHPTSSLILERSLS